MTIADSGNGRGHHHAPDAFGVRKAQDAFRALHSGTDYSGRIPGLFGDDDSRNMHHRLDIGHGRRPTRIVEEVGLHDLEAILPARGKGYGGRLDRLQARAGSDRAPHQISGAEEFTDKMPGNEARSSGDENAIHYVPPNLLNGYTLDGTRESGKTSPVLASQKLAARGTEARILNCLV
jgi:hypothetical protein